MTIQESKQGAVNVLKPQGPLIGEDTQELSARLHSSLRGSMGRCVLDASAVPYVDSLALEVLCEVTDELGDNGQALKLCGVSETLRQVLELTGLSPRFEHFEDVNTAVRSFL